MANIDTEKLTELTAKADEIFLSPDGEQVLVDLITIQAQVELAIDEAKKKLEAAALKVNPNFTSIQANRIKVYYRAFGQKYYIDEQNIRLAPKDLYTTEEKIVYKIDTKAVEKWIDQHGGMPAGITEVERKKAITFTLKGGDI
jgi:hypothetical protein